MGYTGAVFREFYGTQTGFMLALAVLLCWIALPLWLSLRKFSAQDL
jgi:Cu-processing system permease protein